MNIFFDTSALAKRYVNEQGSEQVDEQLSIASTVVVAAITKVEILSAISKAHRANRLNDSEYHILKATIDEDFKFYTILPLNETIEMLAIEGIERYSLKTLDAIQYASCVQKNVTAQRKNIEINSAIYGGV